MMQLKPIPPPPDATGVTDDNGKPVKWFEVNGEPVWVSQSMTDAEVIAALTPKPQPLPAGAPVRDMLSPSQQQAYSQAQMQGPGIVDMLTGSSRRIPGIPEIGDMAYYANPQGAIGTTVQKFTQTDPEELARYYLQSIPGAQLVRDDGGRPMLAYPDPSTGQQRIEYVNAPGISPQDITSAAGIGALFAGAGKVPGKIVETGSAALARLTGQQAATKATPAVTGLAAAGREAVGAGIVGAGVEAAQSVTGGEFSPANVAIETVAGGMAPSIAKAFGSVFGARGVSANPAEVRSSLMATSDAIGGEQGDAMKQAIASMPDDFITDIARNTAALTDPDEIGKYVMAKAFEREIPGFQPLLPYVSGKPSDYVTLDDARRGSFGNMDEIARIDEVNREAALRRGEQLIGETPRGQAGDAFQRAGYGVKERGNELWQQIGKAYDLAAEKQGRFVDEGVGGLVGYLDEAIGGRGIDELSYPQSTSALRQFEQFLSKAAADAPAITPETPVTQRYNAFNPMREGRSIAEYAQLRRNLNGLYESAKGDDRRAIVDMIRGLDTWADDMERSAFYAGDEGAIDALKAANSLRREYGTLYQENKSQRYRSGMSKPDPAGRVIQDLVERDDLDGQAIGNMIVSGVNTNNAKQSAAVLDRLGKILPRDSVEWKAIQEGTVHKLLFKPDGTMRQPADIKRDVDKILHGEHKDIGRRIFDDEMQGALSRFSILLDRTTMPKGLYSPSGGVAAARIGEQISRLAKTTWLLGQWGDNIAGMVTRGIDPTTNVVNVAPRYIPSANLRGKVSAAVQVGGQQALGAAQGGSESNRQKTEGK